MDYHFRPITFEGVTFRSSVMGISVLEPIIPEMDDESAEWIWRFPICSGTTKSAPAALCHRSVTKIIDLMLEHREAVLAGIVERFSDAPFDVEGIYSEWVSALTTIQRITRDRFDDCSWSAPSHPKDAIQTSSDVTKMLAALDRLAGQDEKP
jgi:hypothetical protein